MIDYPYFNLAPRSDRVEEVTIPWTIYWWFPFWVTKILSISIYHTNIYRNKKHDKNNVTVLNLFLELYKRLHRQEGNNFMLKETIP